MVHKIIISLLLIGLMISLASGLVYLFKDVGTTRRTMHSLGVRVTLAALLVATIFHGFLTGQLGVGAPWDKRKYQQLEENTPAEPATNAKPNAKPSADLSTPAEQPASTP